MSTQVHHAIPTSYRGIRFRSRLEARWAAFFDRVNWGWQYEPIDLNGYIPDFVLQLDDGPLLVEVKPEVLVDGLRAHCSKIEESGWKHEALIVGSDVFEHISANPLVGLIGERERTPDGLGWLWSPARLFSCLSCGHVSVLAEDGSWRCRVCGCQEHHIAALDRSALRHWSDAGNRVQWRPGA